MDICSRWRYRLATFFAGDVDLIMDNKRFSIPTYVRGARRLKMRKVRGHLRMRGEGIEKGFAKPSAKKHKVNPGATVSVRAGIINNKVFPWEYLPEPWSGAAAEETYGGPILKALKKHRGVKKQYTVLEDNDPAGYKPNKAMAEKQRLNIRCPSSRSTFRTSTPWTGAGWGTTGCMSSRR